MNQMFAYQTWSKGLVISVSDIATGGGGAQGGRVPPLTVKKLSKIGKRGEKIRKKEENREEKVKSGKFFHFANPDR